MISEISCCHSKAACPCCSVTWQRSSSVLRRESANLLSVGAIDLGIIVDATVIMLENIFRHLAHHGPRAPAAGEETLTDKLHRVLTSAVEVDKAIFFSVIITVAAFLPLF